MTGLAMLRVHLKATHCNANHQAMKRKKKIKSHEQVTWTKMITVRNGDTIKAKRKKQFLMRHGVSFIHSRSVYKPNIRVQTLHYFLYGSLIGCFLAQHPQKPPSLHSTPSQHVSKWKMQCRIQIGPLLVSDGLYFLYFYIKIH